MANNKLPRGIRNCNPLNIRRNPSFNWVGESIYKEIVVVVDNEQRVMREYDKAFCQFSRMALGYRAAAILLNRYIKRGWDTYEKIISRWAPANENNTAEYINKVTKYCQAVPDDDVKFCSAEIIPLMAAMTIVENGAKYDPFKNNEELLHDLRGGFRLAEKYVL